MTSNTIISVTDGSFFAEAARAYDYITVVPATAAAGEKIFSNGELSFYYSDTLTLKVNNLTGVVALANDDFVLALVGEAKKDHTVWTASDLKDYFRAYTGAFTVTDQTIEQLTISNNAKLTKISFMRVDDEALFTHYLFTVGTTTYLIEILESTTRDATMHNTIVNSLIELD